MDLSNGVSLPDTSSLKVAVSGVYEVRWDVSFEALATGTYDWDIVVNGTNYQKCTKHQDGEGITHAQSTGSGCFIRLYANDIVNLQVHDDTTPVASPVMLSENVKLIRVGN